MIDNKLTDNEIIKALEDNKIVEALECCLSDNPPCFACKYDGDTTTVDECMGELMKDALDLINRQKAEIERLEAIQGSHLFTTDFIRCKAVKEFAERLHEYINGIIERHEMPMFPFSVAFVSGMETKIDNLVKEMVGEG